MLSTGYSERMFDSTINTGHCAGAVHVLRHVWPLVNTCTMFTNDYTQNPAWSIPTLNSRYLQHVVSGAVPLNVTYDVTSNH